MGIVNATPDSFSDGGKYFEPQDAINHAIRLIDEGADIIDIGGESTRPYSEPVSVEEEKKRVIPVIKGIKQLKNTPVSIDTRNAATARAAIEAGADIINDVSACEWDPEMAAAVQETGAPVILNHSKGTPDIMQDNTEYADIVEDIYDYFYEKLKALENSGIKREKMIVDPGIGFGKSVEQNYELIRKIDSFKSLGCPLLVGHSRKSFLQKTFNTTENVDIATNAVSAYLLNKGVNFIRVHDVKSLKILLTIHGMLITPPPSLAS
jgi:dihydropteroate synthase